MSQEEALLGVSHSIVYFELHEEGNKLVYEDVKYKKISINIFAIYFQNNIKFVAAFYFTFI